MPKINRKPEPGQVNRKKVLASDLSWGVQFRSHVWSPPTDLCESEHNYLFRVEIAGMHDDDFNITLEKNTLVVSGVRSDAPERRAYHQMEIRFGEFMTAVELPGAVDIQKASATYADGFLTVILPKAVPKFIKAKD